ncbi:MAG TPA: MFS transporter [Bryobacteraceae bacterium]|nr:MFS transporter [Bryobacteraceae bacterium]
MTIAAYSRLLRSNRNVRLLWFAQLISEIGDWLYAVAIYSLILEVTGSAKAVAFAFLLQVLPQTFFAPAAGVLNDRLSRRKLMLFADVARAVVTFCMLFAQSDQATWLLYVLLFLETVFWSLFEPGRTSVIPNITSGPEESLVANSLSTLTWSVSLAFGSGLGGLLAASFGRNTVFLINALSFLVSAFLIRSMRFKEPHLDNAPPFHASELTRFTPIAEGARYVRQDPRLLVTMFVKTGTAILGANWIILPIYGERMFRVGSNTETAGMLGMSLLMCSRGIGALIGPLLAGVWSGHNEARMRYGIVIAFAIASAGYLTVSQATSLVVVCFAIAVAHSGGSIAWVFSTTLLQKYTDDKFRGRVFSAEFAFLMAALSVVTFTGGTLVDAGLPVRSLAFAVGILILIPGLLWIAAQKMWRNEAVKRSSP